MRKRKSVHVQIHAPVACFDLQISMDMGNLAEAEQIWRRALAIKEDILGTDDIELCSTISNLGILYRARKLYAEAASWHNRALLIRTREHGPAHPDMRSIERKIALRGRWIRDGYLVNANMRPVSVG